MSRLQEVPQVVKMQSVCGLLGHSCINQTDIADSHMHHDRNKRIINLSSLQNNSEKDNLDAVRTDCMSQILPTNSPYHNGAPATRRRPNTLNGTSTKRKVFTAHSQRVRNKDTQTERSGGYAAIHNTRILQENDTRMMQQDDAQNLQPQETFDPNAIQSNVPPHILQSQTIMKPQMYENRRYTPMQQHPGLTLHPNTRNKTRSRFHPANICCSCCCDGNDAVQLQQDPINDPNRSIILKPIRRERIVEVMVEEIQERVINVPQIQFVDKYVEVPKPVFQYKIKEVKRPVIVEKIKKVPKIVEEEKIIEVPEIRYVEKEVEVPHIVKKEKIVEVPLPVVRERRIPVLRLRKNERFQEVDDINYNEFGVNITSIRDDGTNAPTVPNNTPIKRDAENRNEQLGFHSEMDATEQIDEMDGATRNDANNAEYTNNTHHTDNRTNPQDANAQLTGGITYAQYNSEIEQRSRAKTDAKWEETRRNWNNEHTNAISVTTAVAGFKNKANDHDGQMEINTIAVSEFTRLREPHDRAQHHKHSYEHLDRSKVMMNNEEMDGYDMQRELCDDEQVSIYPNINALSITSREESDTQRDKQRSSSTRNMRQRNIEQRYMEDMGHTDKTSQVRTHVHITNGSAARWNDTYNVNGNTQIDGQSTVTRVSHNSRTPLASRRTADVATNQQPNTDTRHSHRHR